MDSYVSTGTMDLDDFSDKVSELLEMVRPDVTFTMDEPTGNDPEGVTLPVITFDTYERVRSKSFKSLEPILFDHVKNPDFPGSTLKLYRMWFDTEVEFHIFHQTNREARTLLNEFEDFLFTYKGHFKELGISDMIFLAELPPTVITKWQMDVPRRTLRYLVRIERITTVRSNNLKFGSVDVNVDKGSVNKDSVNYDSNRLMDHYLYQTRLDD